MAQIIHLTENDFDRTLQEKDCVLIDFFSEWCGPCKVLGKTLEALAEALPDDSLTLAKVDVMANPDLAVRFGIMNVPVVMLFLNGKEVCRETGALSRQQLADLLKKHCG